MMMTITPAKTTNAAAAKTMTCVRRGGNAALADIPLWSTPNGRALRAASGNRGAGIGAASKALFVNLRFALSPCDVLSSF